MRLPRLRSVLTVAVTVGIFALAAAVLQRQLSGVHWTEVVADLAAVNPVTVLAALLCCGISYASLAFHEVLAIREAAPDGRCTPRRAIATALVAYPIGHAVGVGALSGGAVRLRWYTAAGLSLSAVGEMVLLCMVPYAVGLGVLFSVSLIFRGGPASALLGVPAGWATGLALFFLSFHAVYLVATERVRGHWQWPGWLGGLSLKLPSGRLTRRQYLVGIVDVGSAAAILWLFLPPEVGLSYPAFLPLYVLCIFAALASNVPAGLGVFESVLLAMLPHVPPGQLVGAMLLYRCVYEVLPLALAVLGLAAAELAGKGRAPKSAADRDAD